MTTINTEYSDRKPDIELNVLQTFDLDVDLKVPGFSEPNEHVPSIDSTYQFDKQT